MATGHLHLSLFDDGKSGSRSRATLAHQIWPINSGPPMKGIFVSYRRKDRPYATSLLVSKLDDCFGKEYVFHDLADIEIGENFLDRIDSALNSCFALVAVIGPDWLKHCKKKLHRANDPVRLEISTALARGILVIPVLCNAKMPDPDDLPEDLREFHNLCADSWYVSNLSSNRATFIQVVDKVALSDGITLVFGRKLFTFHFLYPHGATPA